MQQFSSWLDLPRRRREDTALDSLRATDSGVRASLARIASEATDPGLRTRDPDQPSPSGDIRSVGPPDAALPDAWIRLWRRAQLPEQLIVFHDELAEALTETAICDTLARHAVRIVGAYQAVVLCPAAPVEGQGTLRVAGRWSNGAPPHELVLDEVVTRCAPGLMDAGALGSRRAAPGLVPLAAMPGVATLAMVPVGREGLLVLSERRTERIFTQDDWKVLESLASHAERALARVRALEEARRQALVDPLTGLANRRHMEVFLQHAWAGARRGEGLAVMLLDLDGFKEINDRHGHATGDDILRVVSEILRTEVRGSDAVVRYGGDEFLVILPRADADAAHRLCERVRRRLQGWVGATAGIAVYHPSHATPLSLIEAADVDLYARKQARSGARHIPAAN